MNKLLKFLGRHRFAMMMTFLIIGIPLCLDLPIGFVILLVIWIIVLTNELKRYSKK